MNDRIAAIIVAAGTATRYGSNKILDEIGSKPVLLHSLETFVSCREIDEITIVVQPDLVEAVRSLASRYPLVHIVSGGQTRQQSVARGLESLANVEFVLIHDGARPLVTGDIIQRVVTGLRGGADAAIAAIPVVDTIKRELETGIETVDRTALFRAQTPQGFKFRTLKSLMERAESDGMTFTDESALFERFGGSVTLVQGDERNLKLTVPEDRAVIEALLHHAEAPVITRNGIGYDVHQLVEGRPLVLGGVAIPHSRGLVGHSDADVIIHALADAILGACALGDIGQHFPPGDEQFRDIDSLILLKQVADLILSHGASVIHCDVMVIAEEPKLAPHVPLMRERIAVALGVSPGSVSIKATTNEGMGFVGRKEGIAALATVTVGSRR